MKADFSHCTEECTRGNATVAKSKEETEKVHHRRDVKRQKGNQSLHSSQTFCTETREPA